MEILATDSEKGVGLDYWMKWQVPVCALIIAIPAAVSTNLIKTRLKAAKPLNFDDLWVPCWRNLDPRWLLVYRALAFLSMASLLYQMLLFAGPFALYFYTQWTFALVMVYFAVGTIISAQGCLMSSGKAQIKTGDKDKLLRNGLEESKLPATSGLQTEETSRANLQNHNNDGAPRHKARFLGHLMQIIYQTSAGASILTDLVFWCILVPMLSGKGFELTLLIGSIHTVNAVFLVIDSILNALEFEWFGFTYFILWSVTYTTFQWILHACGFTWWPYPFLELSTPWAPLWYLALAVIHVPCYGFYILLVKAKNSIFSKLFPRAFVRSHEQGWCNKKAA